MTTCPICEKVRTKTLRSGLCVFCDAKNDKIPDFNQILPSQGHFNYYTPTPKESLQGYVYDYQSKSHILSPINTHHESMYQGSSNEEKKKCPDCGEMKTDSFMMLSGLCIFCDI